MKKENELVLELCKFIAPDREKIQELMDEVSDYPFVLGQLLFNRVGAAAYYTLRECELLGRVNREFRNSLKAMYDIGVEKTESFEKCLSTVSDILDGVNFRYAFLKGAYLYSAYPKGLRTSNDIDIMLERDSLNDICELLKRSGFIQGNIRNGRLVPASRVEIINSMINRGETVPFIKKVDLPKMEFCEIDLNFSLDYKPVQDSVIISDFLDNSRLENNVKIFSPIDFLIHLCIHLYKEATIMSWVDMQRDLSLYKFCDIYLLTHKWMNEAFAAQLEQRVKRYGLEKECCYALHYTKLLFDIQDEALDKLLANIKPNNVSFLKEVFDPQSGKLYKHKKSLLDWFFSSDRKRHLYEVTNEKA
ncbi:MAG: nucleotidyltransferase family protein [Clostridiales bacterium]|nr:nucleotidyltransferase family protein [Clostridiales bacterium]